MKTSVPQFPKVSTARGTQVHPTPDILVHWSGACVSQLQGLLHSPFDTRMTGVSGDVTMISSAAGLPLSHPAMSTSAGGYGL